MRLKLIIIGIVVIVIGLFFASSKVSFAQQWCGGCQVIEICAWNHTTQSENCTWYDGCDGCARTGCASGFYECNRGCCPVGTGGGGGGGGGGGTSECGGSLVNCPAGYVKSQPVQNVFCVGDYGGVSGAFCGRGPGTAQEITGCCNNMKEDEDGNEVCGGGNVQVTTYTCVPICTAVAPATPTLMNPANASNQSSTTASLLWYQVSSWGTACTGANNQYYVYLGTTNPPNYYTTTASNVTSINVTNLTRGSTYYWQIVASNGQLYSSSAVRSFTILNNQIAGTVFYDSANNCGGSGWSTGGVAVSLNGSAGTAVSGTGTFSISQPSPGSNTLAVSIPAGFICSTTAGCNTCSRSMISSPSANNNFYLTNLREAWWQAEGAGVYAGSMAGGVTIRSELPTALTKLILPGSGGTSAALMRASGQTDLGAGLVSSEGWSTLTRYQGKRMDYQYFAARMGVIPLQENDWFSNLLSAKPSPAGETFYYQAGDSIVSDPWVVNSGESYVVFIKGNLRINANITIQNGGFLTFIVKGNVNVDPSVTTLQGLYVMDGNFVTESDYVLESVNDVPLAVEGSIVAWGTISLSRNLGVGNFTTPAEKFSYRLDLLANMPTRMKVFAMNWQEVVPGTFGD